MERVERKKPAYPRDDQKSKFKKQPWLQKLIKILSVIKKIKNIDLLIRNMTNKQIYRKSKNIYISVTLSNNLKSRKRAFKSTSFIKLGGKSVSLYDSCLALI